MNIEQIALEIEKIRKEELESKQKALNEHHTKTPIRYTTIIQRQSQKNCNFLPPKSLEELTRILPIYPPKHWGIKNEFIFLIIAPEFYKKYHTDELEHSLEELIERAYTAQDTNTHVLISYLTPEDDYNEENYEPEEKITLHFNSNGYSYQAIAKYMVTTPTWKPTCLHKKHKIGTQQLLEFFQTNGPELSPLPSNQELIKKHEQRMCYKGRIDPLSRDHAEKLKAIIEKEITYECLRIQHDPSTTDKEYLFLLDKLHEKIEQNANIPPLDTKKP